MLDPVILAQILWTGIATSAPYVLITAGFALTLKVSGLWNFAHAGLMAIAFYTMFFGINFLGLPVLVALLLAVAVTATASLGIEAYGLQVLRDRGSGNLTFFIFTLILSEFIIYVITLLFGTEPETLFKSILSPVTIIGDIAVSDWDILAVLVAASGLGLLYVFLTWSREGQFLNAVADNARLAELYGISARRAWRVVSVIAALFIVAAMYLIGTHGGVVPNSPLELGVFGSKGAVPLTSGPGIDVYHSIAGYVELDPSRYGRPGLFAVYQSGKDGNPGFDANGNPLGVTSSKGLSVAIFEHILHNAATVGFRHDLNDTGLGTVSNGNSINLAFNVPHFDYAHVFLEANTGSSSALAGGSNGPTWKGEFWLTIPIKAVH